MADPPSAAPGAQPGDERPGQDPSWRQAAATGAACPEPKVPDAGQRTFEVLPAANTAAARPCPATPADDLTAASAVRPARSPRTRRICAPGREDRHDCGLALTGTSSDADRWAWDRELAEVAALALPGEGVPAAPPPVVSNTRAAVAAYAEAVPDGIADELRRRLFAAIWLEGRHISSAYEVRRLVTGLMWQAGELACQLASPDIPGLLDRDPDLARIVRRSGGTIAPDGGPLTTAGWRRIRQWRQEWLSLPSQVIPVLIGPDQVVRPGIKGLGYLADLVSIAAFRPCLPMHAETEPRRDTRPSPIARAA